MAHSDDWRLDEDEEDVAAADSWACSSCAFRNNSLMPHCEICGWARHAAPPPPPRGPGTRPLRALMLGEPRLRDLLEAYDADREAFLEELTLLLAHGVALSPGARARATAVAAACREHALVSALLPTLTLPELLAFVKMLDGPRRVRQLRRRQQFLEERRARRGKVRDVRERIARLEAEVLDRGSLTGATARKVRRQVAGLDADQLEFYLLNFPAQPWRELADACHLRPADFGVPHFLPTMFGAEPPEGSLTAVLRGAAAADVPRLLDAHAPLRACYSYLRRAFEGALSPEARLAVARLAPLEDVLWFYEELGDAPGVEEAVRERLAAGEAIDTRGRSRANYGKLMERLLLFRSRGLSFAPLVLERAEARLAEVGIANASCRAVVLGDASGSMEVAINTATIIGSSLSAGMGAELAFFNHARVAAPLQPRTAADVIAVTERVAADGHTSPAAGLWDYYQRNERVDLFVLVSDEEENTPYRGYTFAELFDRYCREVHADARVFLVSFLKGPPAFKGKMRAELNNRGIACQQFRLDPQRPDLSKLPALFAMISVEAGGDVLAVPGGGEAVVVASAAATTTGVDGTDPGPDAAEPAAEVRAEAVGRPEGAPGATAGPGAAEEEEGWEVVDR